MSHAAIGDLEEIAQGNALIRFFHRVDDPDLLSDEEWAERVQQITWVLKMLHRMFIGDE